MSHGTWGGFSRMACDAGETNKVSWPASHSPQKTNRACAHCRRVATIWGIRPDGVPPAPSWTARVKNLRWLLPPPRLRRWAAVNPCPASNPLGRCTAVLRRRVWRAPARSRPRLSRIGGKRAALGHGSGPVSMTARSKRRVVRR